MSLKKVLIVFLLIQNVVFAGVVSSPTDKINLRIHHEIAQIQKETKLGKLSKDQAKSLKSQVEALSIKIFKQRFSCCGD